MFGFSVRSAAQDAIRRATSGQVRTTSITNSNTGQTITTNKTNMNLKDYITTIQTKVGSGQVINQVKGIPTKVQDKATGISAGLFGNTKPPVSGGISFGNQAANPTILIVGGVIGAVLVTIGVMKALSPKPRRRR